MLLLFGKPRLCSESFRLLNETLLKVKLNEELGLSAEWDLLRKWIRGTESVCIERLGVTYSWLLQHAKES